MVVTDRLEGAGDTAIEPRWPSATSWRTAADGALTIRKIVELATGRLREDGG